MAYLFASLAILYGVTTRRWSWGVAGCVLLLMLMFANYYGFIP